MLNFLSLDSCTSSPSVSIFINNKHLDTHQIKNMNSSKLACITNEILIRNSLKILELDYIAVTIGPGSFTGIRVGLSLTQGLCYSANLPIAPINLLDVFASDTAIKSNSMVALHSHGDFIFCKDLNNNSTKLLDIKDLKDKNIFGMGLEKFNDVINYNKLEYSSKQIGEYSIQYYDQIIRNDIGSIQPIYLNEYKIDSNV